MEKMREVLAGTDRKPEEIVQKALSVIADGLWSVAEVAVLHQLGVKGGAGPLFGHPERLADCLAASASAATTGELGPA